MFVVLQSACCLLFVAVAVAVTLCCDLLSVAVIVFESSDGCWQMVDASAVVCEI